MEDRLLAGRYRLESQLGQGGMGSVWRAEHLALHSAVAIKLMDPAIAATPEGAERFRREAQAAASLRSTHVVQVLDYGVEDGTPFLVMELLHGESLASCLEREHRLSPARTLDIVTQVGRAIARAHGANIVHRDLKPDNIFLVDEGDQRIVKVLDFGIAKTPDPVFGEMKTRTGMLLGTPHYMSPEQAEGKRSVDPRTDLWSMAVIVCECLTGAQPFVGETWGELLLNICARPVPVPSALGPVPPGFDAWFAKATSRNLDERFATVQELLAQLRSVFEDAPGGMFVVATASTVAQRAPVIEAQSVQTAPTMGENAATHGFPKAATATTPRKGALSFVVAAAGLLTVTGLGGGIWWIQRTTTVTAPPLATTTVTAGPLVANPSVIATPQTDLTSLPQVAAANDSELSNAPASGAGQTRAPASAPPSASAPAVATPTTSGKAKSAGRSAAAPAPSTRNSAKTLRCYTDSFTGMVRLDAGNRGAAASTYPCQQNPFTGQYQRL